MWGSNLLLCSVTRPSPNGRHMFLKNRDDLNLALLNLPSTPSEIVKLLVSSHSTDQNWGSNLLLCSDTRPSLNGHHKFLTNRDLNLALFNLHSTIYSYRLNLPSSLSSICPLLPRLNLLHLHSLHCSTVGKSLLNTKLSKKESKLWTWR